DLPFTLNITLDGFDFNAVGSGVDPVVFSPDFTSGMWVGRPYVQHRTGAEFGVVAACWYTRARQCWLVVPGRRNDVLKSGKGSDAKAGADSRQGQVETFCAQGRSEASEIPMSAT